MRKFIAFIKTIIYVENFIEFFEDYLGFVKNKNIIYSLRNGLKIITRSNTFDRSIVSEIFFWKVYNPRGFEIKNDDLVVDIGAQIGVFSMFASNKSKNGRIFSFEPVGENFDILKENINLNKLKNITCINKAISNKNGVIKLFLSKENTGGHTIIDGYIGDEKNIEVTSISLESFINENKIEKIDFLKIDCEGAEYEILLNCPQGILKKILKISMEYHEVKYKNINQIKIFLENNGFHVKINNKIPMLYANR